MPIRFCEVCGCTDLSACPGGCKWSSTKRCSACSGIRVRKPLTTIEFDALQDIRRWQPLEKFSMMRRALSAHLHAGRITVRCESGAYVWRLTPAGRSFLENIKAAEASSRFAP